MNTDTLEVLDGIVGDLIRRGLPIDYAQRAAAELADHHRDLVAELCNSGLDEQAAHAEASRRLGDSRTLVKKTVREYQRRYWCGCWRWTTFVFAPIPMLFVAWIGTIALFALLVWPLSVLGVSDPIAVDDGIVSGREWIFTRFVQAWFLFVVPAATMFGLARFARRAAIDWRWVAASACVLALSVCVATCGFPASVLHHQFMDGRPVPADRFVMTVGLVIPRPPSAASWSWYQGTLGRVLLPLAIAAVVLFRGRQLALRSEQLVLDGC